MYLEICIFYFLEEALFFFNNSTIKQFYEMGILVITWLFENNHIFLIVIALNVC